MSAGAVSLQLDAILDGAKDSGDAVDKLEFGMTVDLGDIGKVGLAYIDTKDYTTKTTMYKSVSTSETMISGDVDTAISGGVTTMISGGVTTTISGDVDTMISGGVMTTISGDVDTSLTGGVNSELTGSVSGDLTGSVSGELTGEVSGELTGDVDVTIGDVIAMINGDLTGSISGLMITGGINAEVTLANYDDPTAMHETVPLGNCVTTDVRTPGSPVVTTQAIGTMAECTAHTLIDGEAVNGFTAAFTPIQGAMREDTSTDQRFDSRDIEPGTGAMITMSGAGFSDVNNIKFYDAEDEEVTRGVRWVIVSGSFDADEIDQEAEDQAMAINNACASKSAESDVVCGQRFVYTNSDGDVVDRGTLSTRGTISLDAGNTLDISNGMVTITGPIDVEANIADDQVMVANTLDVEVNNGDLDVEVNNGDLDVDVNNGDLDVVTTHTFAVASVHSITADSTHDITADSTHDITADSTHDITADSTHDITADSTHDITAATTTTTTTMAVDDIEEHKGSRDTHIAAQLNLGAVTGHLGYSQLEKNGANAKTKVTHYGVSGGLGETGMSFLIQARSIDAANGKDTDPWLVALTKGLGGGATVMVEHANDDDGSSGKTRFGLKVDF